LLKFQGGPSDKKKKEKKAVHDKEKKRALPQTKNISPTVIRNKKKKRPHNMASREGEGKIVLLQAHYREGKNSRYRGPTIQMA